MTDIIAAVIVGLGTLFFFLATVLGWGLAILAVGAVLALIVRQFR